MARRKLPEYTAKKLLFEKLDLPYHGIAIESLDKEELRKLDVLNKTKSYVVKVDQGIKKRGKQGLIGVNVNPYKIKKYLHEFAQKGYSRFLVEDFVLHEKVDEKYFALERTREGITVYMSQFGGIDIEEHQDKVESRIIHPEQNDYEGKITEISTFLGLDKTLLKEIVNFFDEAYVSFLEINPFLILDSKFVMLDLAVEVDSAGEFFVKGAWSAKDVVSNTAGKKLTDEEKAVQQLKENSQASLKLDVLNPNGGIFTMLSGGGASITIADEVYNRGFAKELANYADYSGNPNQEETYLYTKQLLRLLHKSEASRKALVIAGGVANFTDVRVTFRGILQALAEDVLALQKEEVKVFVRRGGPNQIEGLAMMKNFLTEKNLYGGVWDQTMVLTDVVNKAIEYVKP